MTENTSEKTELITDTYTCYCGDLGTDDVCSFCMLPGSVGNFDECSEFTKELVFTILDDNLDERDIDTCVNCGYY